MSESVERERDQWKSSASFVLSLLGYIIGLGNLWRFPYVCHKNGGGAFLIPFFVAMFFMSVPMYIFEIGLGQLTGRGKLRAWDRIPIMKGLGYASVILTNLSMLPYMMIMGWSILFIGSSITTGSLPWTRCDNSWNTPGCVSRLTKNESVLQNTNNYLNVTDAPFYEHANTTQSIDYLKTSLSQVQFWRNYVLRLPNAESSLDGMFNWPMMLALFAAYLSVFLITIRGIRSSGKAVYFTATFPYVMLVVLFIRGITLEGAGNGIKELLTPNFSRLGFGEVWIDAAAQSFYSYAIGYSGLTAFGSYNKKQNDFLKQSLFIIPIGICTSIFMGIVTYSILGHMAYIENVKVGEVAFSGPGLVFQVFPAGIALMPLPQLWAVLFFFLLYMVAIDSSFSEFEGIMAIIGDSFPALISSSRRRMLTNATLLISYYLASLMMLSPHGLYIFELINYYASAGICIVFCIMSESLTVGWLWDGEAFSREVYNATGRRLSQWFNVSYKIIIPLLSFSISVFYCIQFKTIKVGDYVYPKWSIVIGWMLSLLSILSIPGYMLYFMWKGKGNLMQRWRDGLKPKHHSEISGKLSLNVIHDRDY